MVKYGIGIDDVVEGPFDYTNDVIIVSWRDLRQEQHSIASKVGDVRVPNFGILKDISSATLPRYKMNMVRSWNGRELVIDVDDDVSRLPCIALHSE